MRLVAIAALLLPATLLAQNGGAVPTMRLSSDGTYLIGPDGSPVFLNGDTAWSLMAEPSDSQIVTYLDDRAAKAYNALIVSLIEHEFATNAPENFLGDPPFTGSPFATPSEAYFSRVDWIIDEAAQRGITLFLAPSYLGWQCGDQGWCAEVRSASEATMRSYGQFVGERYADKPNIVWLIGGDTDPVANNVASKMEEMIAGIKEYDTAHLMTAHNQPEASAQDVWGIPSWLDLNNVYTYSATHSMTRTEYNRVDALPLFLLETAYENEHGSTPLSLRTSAYQAVLWGASLGHFFGNCPIWSFAAPAASSFCTPQNWQDQLNSPGSTTVAYVGKLMRSRRHWLMRPDHANAAMTAGHGSGATRAVTSRAADGSSVIAYLPTQRQVSMNLGQVSGSMAVAWWWSPRSNAATQIGEFPASGIRNFTPPDNNDWVLVIDNATIAFPPPGNTSVPPVPLPPGNLQAQ